MQKIIAFCLFVVLHFHTYTQEILKEGHGREDVQGVAMGQQALHAPFNAEIDAEQALGELLKKARAATYKRYCWLATKLTCGIGYVAGFMAVVFFINKTMSTAYHQQGTDEASESFVPLI